MGNTEEENHMHRDTKEPMRTGSGGGEAVGPGRQIGAFRIEEELGRGGMGVVYLAHDTELDRLVAIKSLPVALAADSEALSRFQREARILASLNHPNIATIYEKIEQTEGGYYLVLEYVPGQTLAEKIKGGPLDLEESLRVALQIAEALSAAHGNGVAHRDLKPSNIKITHEGNVKILDFGLARAVGRQASEKDSGAGRVARIAGTPFYMSPEQIIDKATDHRTDIWSFGCVLYEMLSGMRAFPGDSTSDALASALAAEPDLEMLPMEVSPAVRKVIGKCLTTNSERRYQSAAELRQDLQYCLSALTALPVNVNALWRFLQRPWVAVSAVLVFLALCTTALWLLNRNAKIKWARAEALPRIAQLIEQDNYFAAFTLAEKTEKYISKDPVLLDLWSRMSRNCSTTTTPAGAEIFFSEYLAADTGWKRLGRSPLESIKVPFGTYRWRIQKEGFLTVEVVRVNRPAMWPDISSEGRLSFTLHQEGSLLPEMVWIPPSELELRLWGLSTVANIDAPAYAIDKYEVTNRQFKEFVDKGVYHKRQYWQDLMFVRDGQELSWEQAVAEFRDRTGRHGPSTWEAGTYPEGRDNYPVSGVSWFEAAAYAQFKGKTLPTVYHWINAALSRDDALRIMRLSNFGDGPASVGGHRGMGRFGLYDGAGNVREWCYNATNDSGDWRYCLGGGWDDSEYMFMVAEARSCWDRDKANGLRCAQYLGPEQSVPETAFLPVERKFRDYTNFKPVSDETFRFYVDNLYHYDPTKLNDNVELVDESSEQWRREKITFDAAYSNERVIAQLLLPKGVEPPYQVVVFVPGGNAFRKQSSEHLLVDSKTQESEIGFIAQGGRALLYPVCKGMYERSESISSTGRFSGNPNTIVFRDLIIQISKDLSRSIDYLQTRDDIDTEKLAYFGYSFGAVYGPVMLATEERFKAAILFKGGISTSKIVPSADPANFAPRAKIPILMINGSHDFLFPFETVQRPLLKLLGTPEEDLTHITYPGGHNLGWENRQSYQKDMLDWLDRYLGPVNHQP